MPVLKNKVVADRFSLYKKRYERLFTCAISPKMKGCFSVVHKNRCRSASLTVEAAMVFPVFFFAVTMIWQLFLLLLFQMSVCQEMTEAAMKYAHLGYPERKAEEKEVDISWLYQPLMWNAFPESDRIEQMWVLCLPDDDEAIQVQVNYHFVCEAVFFTKLSVPVQQNFRFCPYVGETDADLFSTAEETDVVYVTEYGTVYHESRACSYLNVAVRQVKTSQVGQERNSFGKRYTLCERCDNYTETEVVYVSSGGVKYHLVASCPALKRTVTEKTREEAENLPPCHKCGGLDKNQEE